MEMETGRVYRCESEFTGNEWAPRWRTRPTANQGMYRGNAYIELWKEMNKLILVLWAEIHDQGPVVWVRDFFCYHSPHNLL